MISGEILHNQIRSLLHVDITLKYGQVTSWVQNFIPLEVSNCFVVLQKINETKRPLHKKTQVRPLFITI